MIDDKDVLYCKDIDRYLHTKSKIEILTVPKLINTAEPPFDIDAWAADKSKLPYSDNARLIKDRWLFNAKTATELHELVLRYIEISCNRRIGKHMPDAPDLTFNPKLRGYKKAIDKFWCDNPYLYPLHINEEKYIDKYLLINNNIYILTDTIATPTPLDSLNSLVLWATDTKAISHPNGIVIPRFLPPIESLGYHGYNKSCLVLNISRRLIIDSGINISRMEIICLSENGSYTVVHAQDMSMYADILLRYRLRELGDANDSKDTMKTISIPFCNLQQNRILMNLFRDNMNRLEAKLVRSGDDLNTISVYYGLLKIGELPPEYSYSILPLIDTGLRIKAKAVLSQDVITVNVTYDNNDDILKRSCYKDYI